MICLGVVGEQCLCAVPRTGPHLSGAGVAEWRWFKPSGKDYSMARLAEPVRVLLQHVPMR